MSHSCGLTSLTLVFCTACTQGFRALDNSATLICVPVDNNDKHAWVVPAVSVAAVAAVLLLAAAALLVWLRMTVQLRPR